MLTLNEIIENNIRDNIIRDKNCTYGDLLNASRGYTTDMHESYYTYDEKVLLQQIKKSDENRLRKFS